MKILINMGEMQQMNISDNLINDQENLSTKNVRKKLQSIKDFGDFCGKQKPQTNAIMMGALAVVNGGMQYGWGIFNHQTVANREEDEELYIVISSWFLTAVVGLFISALLVTKLSKQSIYVSTVV